MKGGGSTYILISQSGKAASPVRPASPNPDVGMARWLSVWEVLDDPWSFNVKFTEI